LRPPCGNNLRTSSRDPGANQSLKASRWVIDPDAQTAASVAYAPFFHSALASDANGKNRANSPVLPGGKRTSTPSGLFHFGWCWWSAAAKS